MSVTRSARARRGGGSVYWDESRKRWIACLDLGADPERPGKRIRPKVSARTKTGAYEELDKLRAEHVKAGTVGRQDVTVEIVLRNLLDNPPASWGAQVTIAGYTARGEHIIKALGKIRYSRLTARQGEEFLRRMAAEGYARQTLVITRLVLVQAERRARRDGLIGRYVAADIEVPAVAGRRVSKAMSREQVGALLALDLSPWWRALIVTAVTTGLRPGELLGLRWEDVDFDAGVIRVRKSLKRPRVAAGGQSYRVLEGLKTERSRRTLKMPQAARRALAALRLSQAQDSGVVFPNAAGPSDHGAVLARFHDLCGRAGIGRDWQLRELRHTFVSQLSHGGIDIEVIADAVGHVNSTITREVYRHQLADTVTAGADVMDDLYGEPSR